MLQDFHQDLYAHTPPSSSSSPLGFKPLNLEKRQLEAKKLSKLMSEQRPFCFLRMGDMDLSYLLAFQSGQIHRFHNSNNLISGTLPDGNPGIGQQQAERLQSAFMQGDYVDFHERLYPMQYWLPKLKLNRSTKLYRNPDEETSYLSLTWLEYEFKSYCQGRRIGIAGAEARLLEILTKQPIWQEVAVPFWPSNANIYFHQVRDDGRNLEKNLDLIKNDLAKFIQDNQIDTLFLSLGGGAKILCYELSREHNICTFDFGAMLRALTYSACDGNRAARSTHSPFLFRVPFNVFMESLEQAFPNLTSEELLAKAHAQIILDVQCKEVGWTHTAWEYDFSTENLFWFKQSYKTYLQRYRHLANKSPLAKKEKYNFLFFCGINKLTFEGCLYYLQFRLKSAIRKILTMLKIIP
jgi:hypothetical protein